MICGHGKAGKQGYKVVHNRAQYFAGDLEPEPGSESVKDLWRKWNLDHKGRVQKDVARMIRAGTLDVFCQTCRRSIDVNKWFKHRTLYNYCKPGDKYLKFDNFKH